MPFYKLVRDTSARSFADEIILAKDDAGKAVSLSVNEAREIEEELLDDAKKLAARLGFKVQEAEEPEEDEGPRQQVGDDVRGMSPVNVGGVDQPGSKTKPGAGPGDGGTAQAPAGTPQPGTGTTPSTSTGAGTTSANPTNS